MKILAALMLLVSVSFQSAAQGSKSQPCRVWLTVSADDDFLRDRIISSMNRHVRDLGDVTMATTKNEGCYGINLVAMTTENKAKEATGFALAASFTYTLDTESLRKYTTSRMTSASNEQEQIVASALTAALIRVADTADVQLSMFLYTGAMEDLETVCQGVVASFDSKVMIPERQFQQLLQDRLAKPQK